MSQNETLEKEIAALKQKIELKEAVEQAMEEIAILFINPSDQDEAFNLALEKLLLVSKSDRAVIMQVNADDSTLISMSHEKCRKGFRSAIKHAQDIPRKENPWFKKTNQEMGYVQICDTSKLPDEAVNEKKILQRHHIGAALISSFASNNQFRGNLHLERKKPIDAWPSEIIRMVIFVAVLIEHSIERKETELKLFNEKERAEQSDRMKSAFMANLSHEIRTPLNGIMGFTRLMIRNRFNENKKNHYASQIEKSSNHLLAIIDDLIDLSRIESGSIQLIPGIINIKDTILGVYESFYHDLPTNKDLKIRLEIPTKGNNLNLRTDPRRLRQIIDNLMKNAIRYTSSGIITLGYKTDKKKLSIFVNDTGIGISKENLDHVFNRFWQVDHAQARTYGGSGLGLSISKDFAKMLGGDIIVKSKPGKGSQFILELPIIPSS